MATMARPRILRVLHQAKAKVEARCQNDDKHARTQNNRAPTAPRTRLLAKLVGAFGMWFHFASHFGRGRCAMAFRVMPFQSAWHLHTKE
jgi:hypothetical protein